MMKKIFFLLLPAVCLMYACQQKPTEIDFKAISEEIVNIENQLTAAYQAQDIDKCMSYYAPDAILMGHGIPSLNGVESIRKDIETEFADTTKLWKTHTWKNEQIEVAASGDMVIVRGSSVLNMKTPGGIKEVKKKGLEIFKKMDGEWKTFLCIYNKDM